MQSILGNNLQMLVGFAIIPGILGTAVLIPMHETPKFLLIFRQDKEAAVRSIKYYHGQGVNADSVLDAIEKVGT
jgi:hypothetical protein